MATFEEVFGSGGCDLSNYEPAQDYDVIPPGKYTVEIEKSEVKQTKTGTGHYLALCFSILDDGELNGRKLFVNLNIQNPSEKAQEIALRQLRSLGDAVGLVKISSEDQLLGKVCVASVKVGKDGKNDVRSYEAFGATQQATPPAAQSRNTEQTSTAGGQSKPPWVK